MYAFILITFTFLGDGICFFIFYFFLFFLFQPISKKCHVSGHVKRILTEHFTSPWMTNMKV